MKTTRFATSQPRPPRPRAISRRCRTARLASRLLYGEVMKTVSLLALALSSSLFACASVDTTDATDGTQSSAATNHPRFDLAKDATGYHFALHASDGTLLLSSQAYSSRTSAI